MDTPCVSTLEEARNVAAESNKKLDKVIDVLEKVADKLDQLIQINTILVEKLSNQ